MARQLHRYEITRLAFVAPTRSLNRPWIPILDTGGNDREHPDPYTETAVPMVPGETPIDYRGAAVINILQYFDSNGTGDKSKLSRAKWY